MFVYSPNLDDATNAHNTGVRVRGSVDSAGEILLASMNCLHYQQGFCLSSDMSFISLPSYRQYQQSFDAFTPECRQHPRRDHLTTYPGAPAVSILTSLHLLALSPPQSR